MMGSSGLGESSGMIPNPILHGPEPFRRGRCLRCPRQSAASASACWPADPQKIRAVALPRVNDLEIQLAHGTEHATDGFDARTGQRNVVAHELHLASATAKISLHIDDHQGGVVRAQISVVGPGIGLRVRDGSLHSRWFHSPNLSTRPFRNGVDIASCTARPTLNVRVTRRKKTGS